MTVRPTPSYRGLRPSSAAASRAARASSRKVGTKCELVLRRALWSAGFRYRVSVRGLPGNPDIAFLRERVAIFCDGDFWHGRDLEVRVEKLKRGHNAPYWVQKIRSNASRDQRRTEQLQQLGWRVVRLWEKDILRCPEQAVLKVSALLNSAKSTKCHRKACFQLTGPVPA